VAHALPRFAEMPRFQNQTLTAKQSTWEFSASDKLGLLQLSLRTRGQRPEQALQSVTLEVIAD
jgi:hypothetical protein